MEEIWFFQSGSSNLLAPNGLSTHEGPRKEEGEEEGEEEEGMMDAWLRRLAPPGAAGERVRGRELWSGGRAVLVVCTRRPG